jgi:non-reducing end alpha-L-arabinofuranosidase
MSNLKQFIRLTTPLFVLGSILLFQKNTIAIECPCDIYEETGTPCVGAFSTTRLLSSKYTGPIYQVRRADGQTKDIPQTDDGFADSKVQDDFLGNSGGTISKLYDQSGKGNDLTVAKKGCFDGTASQDDNESDAKGRKVMVGGHNVYALYMKQTEGYRSNQEGYSGYPKQVDPANGMPKNNENQGIYEVVDGKRYGTACCWNFGNGSTDNCYGPTGQMNTCFFGTAYWGRGAGSGPWFMNDMEAGVWAGGSKPGDPGWGALDAGGVRLPNNDNPSITWDYAMGISKTSTENRQAKYCLRMGNAQSGNLVNAWDGNAPTAWKMEGGIILGIGGDNSNSSFGTFFEGCITAGRPSNETDAKIHQNIQNIGYGKDKVATLVIDNIVPLKSMFSVHNVPSTSSTAISFTLTHAQQVNMNVFDQQGRQIATIVSGIKAAGRHKSVWNTRQATPGVYVVKTSLDGKNRWTDKIVIGK